MEKKPENGGTPRQREAADDEAAERERHRLAEAAHPVERLLAAPSRAMIEPAAMNSSALKKACVIRWNRPADVGAGARRP